MSSAVQDIRIKWTQGDVYVGFRTDEGKSAVYALTQLQARTLANLLLKTEIEYMEGVLDRVVGEESDE